jgi:hypothetical protein
LVRSAALRPEDRTSITRSAGSLLTATIPRVPLLALLRFGAPLHPGLYSGRPPSRASNSPKGETPLPASLAA